MVRVVVGVVRVVVVVVVSDSMWATSSTASSVVERKINSFKIGTWVEFSLNTNSKFRCKLSTVTNNALIFVNRMGLKVLEKTKLELAKDINTRKVKIIEENPLINRTINSVINDLKINKKAS